MDTGTDHCVEDSGTLFKENMGINMMYKKKLRLGVRRLVNIQIKSI